MLTDALDFSALRSKRLFKTNEVLKNIFKINGLNDFGSGGGS